MENEKVIKLDLTGCKYLAKFKKGLEQPSIFQNGTNKIGMLFGTCYGANAMMIKLRY